MGSFMMIMGYVMVGYCVGDMLYKGLKRLKGVN